MNERRERISEALRACAEAGVPETAAPWPEIRDRALAGKRPERRSSRRFRLVPHTRVGWVFVALLMMFFGTGAYAASSWVDELFGYALPQIAEENFGVPLNQSQTINGVTFTLDKAYADEGNVVVGYSVEGFDNRLDSNLSMGILRLTDGSDRSFEYVGGLGMVTDPMDESVTEGRSSDLAIFDPSGKLDSREGHSFSLKLDYELRSGEKNHVSETEPDSGTVTFDFDVPVHEMPIVQVGETVQANGVEMTLDRVENSPARAQAILCFDPPQDGKYYWVPIIDRPNIAESDVFTNDSLYMREPEEVTGCVGYDLFRSLYDQPGSHSFTVTQIEGRSRVKVNPDETIQGPWTFEFEVPEK